jgi:hypothetical protein
MSRLGCDDDRETGANDPGQACIVGGNGGIEGSRAGHRDESGEDEELEDATLDDTYRAVFPSSAIGRNRAIKISVG